MCGIIAVLRGSPQREPPDAGILEAAIATATEALGRGYTTAEFEIARAALAELDQQLRGIPGLLCLLAAPGAARRCSEQLGTLQDRVGQFEATLDQDASSDSDDDVEQRNAALLSFKDALWAVCNDRLPNAEAVRGLANATGADGDHVDLPAGAATSFANIQSALSALDRLEVRGRDSAGLSILVTGIDPDAARFQALLRNRTNDPLFTHRTVRKLPNGLDLVYKHAAEIGELGDNVQALRSAITADELLQTALRVPTAETLVLGHTRWASVGVISQPNAHPLNHEETSDRTGSYVIGALNGDVDNHNDLVDRHGLEIAPEITTDAKVIPVLVSRQMAAGHALSEAFRRTVAGFEGSVAIAAASADEPHRIALALRGSGQALYVGIAEDTFVVASEPYGVIEECGRYLRMDGDTPSNPDQPHTSRGQVIVLDRRHAGELAGITRCSYDGTQLPVKASDLVTPSITTRDIDRRGFRHFLHKEIGEAPQSLQKTLRGRIVRENGQLRTVLPEASLPTSIVEGLRKGRFRRVLVIGQGTAAVAGQAIAAAIGEMLAKTAIDVRPIPATELSGFGMRADMSDTLIVAISQSGTTTDTNRTVDLVRGRGAPVLAIVNRRGSDLTDKADGVVYTSDGRDVEMSVASTKAFYAQCAAGWLLALALARAAGVGDDEGEHALLTALAELPSAMHEVLEQDAAITEIARELAPRRRYWALVGNGNNRIAAAEVRIKLSELCYKSIACDATEDKKHIDLSAEPMILVCASGLSSSTADDVAKEVAIYQAHMACPIIIATEGEDRFSAASAVITVPPVHPSLAYILSTMAGHLFGYRAALAIDALALPLRRARGVIEEVAADPQLRDNAINSLETRLQKPWTAFRKELIAGNYDGALEARTAARLTSLFNYVLGFVPLESYAIEFGQPGTPGTIVDSLVEELTQAIDQMTRPVDAIKHQAKTVTVGITRSDESLLTVPLVRATMDAGAPREHLGYRDLRALAGLDPAVARVLGSTRYRIDDDLDQKTPTITVIDQQGVATKIRSRTTDNSNLRGTKHLVAMERTCFVARGRNDDRTVIMVPEVSLNRTVGITLLHVEFAAKLPAATLRGVLESYRNRYAALADAVTETEPQFDEDLLEQITVTQLLTEPVLALADYWRQGLLRP